MNRTCPARSLQSVYLRLFLPWNSLQMKRIVINGAIYRQHKKKAKLLLSTGEGDLQTPIPGASRHLLSSLALEAMATTAVQNNLMRYLSRDMHFSVAKSANMVTTYVGTANLMALPGGFLSDSFFTRFTVMGLFGAVELMGYLLLTLQAYFPSLKPAKCSIGHKCQEASGIQNVVLLMALYLIALGTGFMKSNLLAHGADQFDQRIPRKLNQLSNFFNWSYFGVCFGSLIAITLLVWVQDNISRYWGFGISATVMFLAFVSLFSGITLYRNKVPKGSPLTRILQVFVAALRNRRIPVTHQQKEAAGRPEHHLYKDKLRFLDRACMEYNNKRRCSVEQVEETKAFLRVLPIFGSTIVMNCAVAQLQTFSVQQGSTMLNRQNVPPASLSAIPLAVLLFVVPLYDSVFVPFARRLTGHPRGVTTLRRTGLGLIFSAASMAVAAIVETARRSSTTTKLSISYLLPQLFLSSFAEFFTRVGLVEFFYTQSSPQMRSMSVALNSGSVSLGYFLSSALVSLTNGATSTKKSSVAKSGGWLSSNDLNEDHLDRFYWLLCAISVVNFFNYVFWAISYDYVQSNPDNVCHQNNDGVETDNSSSCADVNKNELTENLCQPQ